MRLTRVDAQNYGSLTGTFFLPAGGLGVWAAPNQAGKTRLTTAIAAALYGEIGPPPKAAPGEPTWVAVQLVRDDGTALAVARDLASGAVRVTDADQQDATSRYHRPDDGVEVGETLLGLTRSQFLEAACVRHEELRGTAGNRALLSLLQHGRGRTPGAPVPAAAPPPSPAAPAAGDDAPADDDLRIIRSAAEELGYVQSAPPTSSPAPANGPTDEFDDPDEPGLDSTQRLRRMRAAILGLARRLNTKQEELRSASMRLQDVQSEADRLSTLTGAEPQDVEKLGSLIEVMKNVQSKREQLRTEESKRRHELEEAEIPIEHVEQLDSVFRGLDEDELAFLDGYRENEMVRRGTQALLRSECRLDETRIQEIGVSRGASARLAALPLSIAILGLGGSIAVQFTGWALATPQMFLGLGGAGAILGILLLWRARGLRRRDERELTRMLEGRHAKLATIDHEMQETVARITALAERLEVEKATDVLDLHEQWKEHHEETRALATFRARAEEIDREIVTIREKLDSFSLAEDDSGGVDSGVPDLERLYQDYVRFFEVQQQADEEETRGMRLEEELADLESEKADLTARLERALARAGIDASRDLDEAVERFALKDVEVEIDPPARSSRTREAPRGEDVEAEPGDSSWIPAISARAEAIVRRFLPEIRQLEVDAELLPSLQLDPRGPRIGWREIERELSTGALDQLCLALRLAIVETVSSSGERFPVFLDDPLVRTDDARHDLALDFLVEDAAGRNQIVLLTSQGTRLRWFLHQAPHLSERVVDVTATPTAAPSARGSGEPSAARSHSSESRPD